jgi:hypothetical protein
MADSLQDPPGSFCFTGGNLAKEKRLGFKIKEDA